MTEIRKDYAERFVLEPTKLISILEAVHERLGEHPGTTRSDHFEVFMSGDRCEVTESVEAVLKLTNSRKHTIERVVVVCSAATPGSVRPEHDVQIDFGVARTKPPSEAAKAGKMVAVRVRSDANAWASRTLSELEEQLERTWVQHTPPLTLLFALIGCATLVTLSQLVTIERRIETVNWLQSADVQRVKQMLDSHRILTEEEAREVTTMQLRNVVLDQMPTSASPKRTNRKTVVFGSLFVILVAIGVGLISTYPQAVFLWGDEIARNASRERRRQVLWGLIFATLVTSVAGRLFFESVSQLIPG